MPKGTTFSRIAEEAATYGVMHTHYDGTAPIKWKVTCGSCQEAQLYGWPIDTHPRTLVSKLRQRGWNLELHHTPVCKSCQKEAAMTKPTTGPDLKLARRIYSLLDENFHEGSRLYRDGWNDERVAKEADAALDVVVKFRREAYGELAEDPALQALRDDLAILRMEVEDIREKFKVALTPLEARIDELIMRIAKVRPAVVPVLRSVS